MKILSAKYEAGKLILETSDMEAKRIPYNFKPGDYTLTPERKKRSLDANAYAWVLISKMADVLGRDKDSVYRDMLKSYGQGGVAKILNADAERFLRAWKYSEPHEKLAPEAQAQYYRFWVGSSQYNTKEMSYFIDGIINECRDMDIETLTPAEVQGMKDRWQND